MTHWQPIETAPKEIKVLVWNDYGGQGHCTIAELWYGSWLTSFAEDDSRIVPTHWMPLPDSPVIQP